MDAIAKQGVNTAEVQEKPQVIVIAATEQQPDRLRVAAYTRVSSDSDDQLNSFAAQVRHYTDLISANAQWTLADIYADEGITGTSADKRDEFQRLLADCRRGKIDRILVKSVSRFARNTLDCLAALRELKTLGVSVLFENDGIDTARASGEMLTSIFAGFAQAESENTSKRMRWSYQRRMERGIFLPSSMPYGYELRDGKIEIDEEQAAVVRRIFADYLAGISMNEIAAYLNQANSDASMTWYHTTVSYILTNEKYTGDSLWQKRYATDTLPARPARNKGEKPKYYVENTHAGIISKNIFSAAQELIIKRRKEFIPNRHLELYPLRKKLKCGCCSNGFRRKADGSCITWLCVTHSLDKDACPVKQIPEQAIYDAFLRLYHKLKTHGQPTLQQMLNQLTEVRQKRFLWRTDIIELNKQIAALSDQDRALNEMKLAGVIDPDIFISMSNSIATQLRSAKLAKERLLAAEDDDSIPKTRELMELLADAPDFLSEFDGELFGELVEKIIVESNTRLRFRLINGLELAEEIQRTVR